MYENVTVEPYGVLSSNERVPQFESEKGHLFIKILELCLMNSYNTECLMNHKCAAFPMFNDYICCLLLMFSINVCLMLYGSYLGIL